MCLLLHSGVKHGLAVWGGGGGGGGAGRESGGEMRLQALGREKEEEAEKQQRL